MQEIMATFNIMFLAWVVSAIGAKSGKHLPDYTEDMQKLQEAVEEAETESFRKGNITVYELGEQ